MQKVRRAFVCLILRFFLSVFFFSVASPRSRSVHVRARAISPSNQKEKKARRFFGVLKKNENRKARKRALARNARGDVSSINSRARTLSERRSLTRVHRVRRRCLARAAFICARYLFFFSFFFRVGRVKTSCSLCEGQVRIGERSAIFRFLFSARQARELFASK